MGWSRRDLDGCSLWQFLRLSRGWIKANCPPPEDGATPEDLPDGPTHREALRRVQEMLDKGEV